MRCSCGGRLLVTHSYNVPGTGGTGRARCDECGTVATVVHFVAKEDPGHGEGAAAIAAKLKEGRLKPRLSETEDEAPTS